jgi:hypothetical protein
MTKERSKFYGRRPNKNRYDKQVSRESATKQVDEQNHQASITNLEVKNGGTNCSGGESGRRQWYYILKSSPYHAWRSPTREYCSWLKAIGKINEGNERRYAPPRSQEIFCQNIISCWLSVRTKEASGPSCLNSAVRQPRRKGRCAGNERVTGREGSIFRSGVRD